MNDVKITAISPLEFSISYINRLPNTHCFRVLAPDLMQKWLTTLELATQQEIHNPYKFSRSRGNSISHTILVVRNTITPRGRGSKEYISPRSHSEKIASVTESLPYYKPTCWVIEELKKEGSSVFSSDLAFQEVYSNDIDDGPFAQDVRQGWRVLGGQFTDILCWCILASDRQDKRMYIMIRRVR